MNYPIVPAWFWVLGATLVTAVATGRPFGKTDVLQSDDSSPRSPLRSYLSDAHRSDPKVAARNLARMTTHVNEIWSSPDAPSLSTVTVQLLNATRTPDTSLVEIVELVKSDRELAHQLLKSVNASSQGLQHEITSVSHAVTLLGRSKLRTLSLVRSLAVDAEGILHSEETHRFWLRAIVSACAAERFAQCTSGITSGDAFLIGLLVDIGQLTLLRTLPAKYGPICLLARARQVCVREIERKTLELDHVEVGCKLIESWGMRRTFVEALRHHHDSPDELRVLEADIRLGSVIARLAACTADYFVEHRKGKPFLEIHELHGWLGVQPNKQLSTLLEEIAADVGDTCGVLGVSVDRLQPLADLQATAKDQLLNAT